MKIAVQKSTIIHIKESDIKLLALEHNISSSVINHIFEKTFYEIAQYYEASDFIYTYTEKGMYQKLQEDGIVISLVTDMENNKKITDEVNFLLENEIIETIVSEIIFIMSQSPLLNKKVESEGYRESIHTVHYLPEEVKKINSLIKSVLNKVILESQLEDNLNVSHLRVKI